MSFEWDPKKADANVRKHGIDFADVVGVFSDPHALTVEDDRADEPRHVTIGLDYVGRVVVVAYTWRGDSLRIITARAATPAERAAYGDRI